MPIPARVHSHVEPGLAVAFKPVIAIFRRGAHTGMGMDESSDIPVIGQSLHVLLDRGTCFVHLGAAKNGPPPARD